MREDLVKDRYPIGRSLSVQTLAADPYPAYCALIASEPLSWVPSLGMWYVTRHADCRHILLDDESFTTVSPHSLIQATFGEQVLSSDGPAHSRYKAAVRKAFMPGAIRRTIEPRIWGLAEGLIERYSAQGSCELRSDFASRLPVLTILTLFGLPLEEEANLRRWYDAFEAALANFTGLDSIRGNAAEAVGAFHALLDRYIAQARQHPHEGLLSDLANAPDDQRLTDDEIRRNVSIIFFGGISTVEALILNTVHALDLHPDIRRRVQVERALLPAVIDETMRWLSPVQSATRHLTCDVELHGETLRAGEVVNCMLAAANRDPSVFRDPDVYDIDRQDLSQHLGFAVGPHHCLGFHLARAEVRIALEVLFERCADWRIDPATRCEPEGFEFRQPRRMPLLWRTA